MNDYVYWTSILTGRVYKGLLVEVYFDKQIWHDYVGVVRVTDYPMVEIPFDRLTDVYGSQLQWHREYMYDKHGNTL